MWKCLFKNQHANTENWLHGGRLFAKTLTSKIEHNGAHFEARNQCDKACPSDLRSLMKIISAASMLCAITSESREQHSNQHCSLTFECRRSRAQKGDTCRGQRPEQSAPYPRLTKGAPSSLKPANNQDKDTVCTRGLIVTAFPIKLLNCRQIRQRLITPRCLSLPADIPPV